jgi:hypothetical protein
MAQKRYAFTRDGAQRIIDAVRQIEKEPTDLTGRDGGDPSAPGRVWVWVKIEAAAAEYSTYTGHVYSGPIVGDPGTVGSLPFPPDGSAYTDSWKERGECVIIDTHANGWQGHAIELNTFALAYRMGTTADQLPIFIVTNPVYRTADPQAIGASTEGSETASASTWNRASATSGTDYGDIPIELWVQTRTVYNEAGDEKLYAFVRKLTFDAGGRLASVSAETRVEVDIPEECA